MRQATGHSTRQIRAILEEAGLGRPVREVCRRHRISDTTFYRWRRRYGVPVRALADRLRDLERENRQLRRQLAGLVSEPAGDAAPRTTLRVVAGAAHATR